MAPSCRENRKFRYGKSYHVLELMNKCARDIVSELLHPPGRITTKKALYASQREERQRARETPIVAVSGGGFKYSLPANCWRWQGGEGASIWCGASQNRQRLALVAKTKLQWQAYILDCVNLCNYGIAARILLNHSSRIARITSPHICVSSQEIHKSCKNRSLNASTSVVRRRGAMRSRVSVGKVRRSVQKRLIKASRS